MLKETSSGDAGSGSTQLANSMSNFLNPGQLQSLSENHVSNGNQHTAPSNINYLISPETAVAETKCVWFSKKQIDKLFEDNCGSEPAELFGLKIYLTTHDKDKDPLPGLPEEHDFYDKKQSAALVVTKIKEGWNEELLDNEAYAGAPYKAKAIYAVKLCPPEVCRVREQFNI